MEVLFALAYGWHPNVIDTLTWPQLRSLEANAEAWLKRGED